MTTLHDAARRALASMNELIADSRDPGTEALAAQHELQQALAAAPLASADWATGLRAAADEIAGIDFHPNAVSRSLDIARGLVHRLRCMADEAQQADVALPFTYTDTDTDQLTIGMIMASTHNGDAPVVTVNVDQHQDDDHACVYVRPDSVEQVIAALRAAQRAARALDDEVQQP